jgi:hypothetical protein
MNQSNLRFPVIESILSESAGPIAATVILPGSTYVRPAS